MPRDTPEATALAAPEDPMPQLDPNVVAVAAVHDLLDKIEKHALNVVALQGEIDAGVARMVVMARERDAARANLEQARQDLSAETAARVQLGRELASEQQVSRLLREELDVAESRIAQLVKDLAALAPPRTGRTPDP